MRGPTVYSPLIKNRFIFSSGSQQTQGELRSCLETKDGEVGTLRKERQQLEGLCGSLKQQLQVR